MLELDHLHIDLAGTNLIEASAGTGKTYAIACLYLRLLIEKDLTPEQILVVTYTEAATKELRGRIRSRIREALGVMDGAATQDAFLAGLADNVNGQGPDRIKSREKLDRALNAFDTASIFTIHGFCLRALQENAFESGSLYDTELVTDQTELLQEIVDDFWRMRFFAEPSPLLEYALHKGCSPRTFMYFIKGMLSNSKLEIIPQFSADEIATIEARCRSSYEKVRQEWQEHKKEIADLVRNDKGLSRAANAFKTDLLPELFAGMDACVAGNNPFNLFPDFCKLTTSGVAQGKKPKGTAPEHPFFNSCEELMKNVEERFLALYGELVRFCREHLPIRKRERNIRFFDDLLNDLYQALLGENGEALSGSIRGKYPAALIDEFQDTDPVQYDIFRKIYAATNYPLFLIGDPKQAIYSFRGADVFAYMEAAGNVAVDKRFTLTVNWRSSPRLLTAFNKIFTSVTNPFVYDMISYHPVKQGQEHDGKELARAAGETAPLQIWQIPPEENGKPVNVSKASEIIPPLVAAEIARLLQEGAEGKAMVDNHPLFPGDIAVIVRSHRQAGYMQEALCNLGIPSVLHSDASIFASAEAAEVGTLLHALADPGSEPKVRAALVTDILGRSGDDIALLLEEELAWDDCLEKFREHNQSWRDRGFMAMAQSLLAREGIRGRLLRYPDGERRLTNLLHCFEIIHRKAHEQKLGIEGLVTWFSEQISAKDAAEEYQIRLETDEKAVKIVTVHVSKGMEYPVVFCPFMWGGISDDDDVITFHEGFAMVKDFGSPNYDQNRKAAQRETLAENLRLLYVALTRAKYRCYLCAGKITGKSKKSRPETSSLAYLFHATAGTSISEDPVSRLADEVGKLTLQEMQGQLQVLQEKSEGTIDVVEMPESGAAMPFVPMLDDGMPLASRKFSGVISSEWRVASFTAFASHETTANELPNRDERNTGKEVSGSKDAEVPAGKSIFTFPRGAQAGIFFHEIFEGLNFAQTSEEAVSSQVEKGLEKFGFDKEWQPHVCNMVNRVLTTPLTGPEGAFSLAMLKPGSWITELEFYFPLRFITSDLLTACLRKWGTLPDHADLGKEVCASLRFRPVRGMVRGFMDMVFEQGGRYYLIDWKSNHLGYRMEDYGQETLKTAMERNLYPLQYLLYTVALNRYLSLRVRGYDYATHFGCVFYVFLRGVSPERGEACGFFRDLPSLEMIDELTKLLIQGGGWDCDDAF